LLVTPALPCSSDSVPALHASSGPLPASGHDLSLAPLARPVAPLTAWPPTSASPPRHYKSGRPIATAPFFPFFPRSLRVHHPHPPALLSTPPTREPSVPSNSEPPSSSSPSLDELPSPVTLVADWTSSHYARTFPMLQVHLGPSSSTGAACRHQPLLSINTFASSCRLATSVRTPPPPPHLVRRTPHASPVLPPSTSLHLVAPLTVSRYGRWEGPLG
jgi:hypothetical protein